MNFGGRGLFRILTTGSMAGMLFAALSINVVAQTTTPTDWPQWRGADRDDLSTETGLKQEWPSDGPENLWTNSDGGSGYAGFAVVGDDLFTLGADDDNEFVLCMNAADGSVKWKSIIGSRFKNRWGDGPRNTPTWDDGKLYVLSAGGELACLNAGDGSSNWTASLTDDFGGKVPNWGYAESVLVDGDQVVCTPGGSDGAIVAINKKTGKVNWQSRMFTDNAHYSSIVIADHPDQRHYVQLVEKAVVGIDPEDGSLLWRQKWPGRTAVIPTPVYSDKTIYVTSGYGAGSMLLDISDPSSVSRLWSNKTMKNHHGGVILLDGHYYGYSDGFGWICQNMKSGELVWNEKDALGKGAIGYADGRFYLVSERSGEVVLIDATTSGWKERGRFKLDPQSENRKPAGAIWVHPVISNGRLYLRDQEMIYCFDVSKQTD